MRLTWLTALDDAATADAAADLRGYLGRAAAGPAGGGAAAADVVVIVADHVDRDLVEVALAGARPVLLLGPTLTAWRDLEEIREAAGLLPAAPTPVHETRIRPGRDAGEVTTRLAGDLTVVDAWPPVDKVLDEVEVVLTANLHYADHPVATVRRSAAGPLATLTVGSRPETLRDPAYQRLVHRLLRHVAGERDAPAVRVGLLGYGAIGHEHNAAIQQVDGLELAAVCDLNPDRIAAARALAPDLTAHADPEALLADDEVDLVVVSTPPNTHAAWVLRTLDAGKHCVVEKPFCLTVAEADAQIAAAADRGLVLAVYQNRRWDADYLRLKALIRGGAIGEVFHYESFVGGYGHPCNYWHSDERVSGGAIYDWGSHFLDWILDLFEQPVTRVSATAHKRRWHDVTNADHSRVLLRLADGLEAEFTHSDLAAAPKPKWYVLGTDGALVGEWRHERVVGRDLVGNLAEDRLTAAESPAALWLHHADGSRTSLSVPPAPPQPFHRELADQLLSGTPMSVTPAGSRRGIAVMEAATESVRRGGAAVAPAT